MVRGLAVAVVFVVLVVLAAAFGSQMAHSDASSDVTTTTVPQTAQRSDATSGTGAAAQELAGNPGAATSATPIPRRDYYEGSLAALPETARDVLRFQPARFETQTQSESIATRVYQACELTDFVGADDFPGRIRVADAPHGWTRVTWTIDACPIYSKGKVAMEFQISHDHRYIRTSNIAAAMLTQ